MTTRATTTATAATLFLLVCASACENQLPANDAWGAAPVGIKHASPKGERLAIHPHFGGEEGSTLGVGGPAGMHTREAAVNGAQTTDENECGGNSDGAARCASETLHVCVAGVEYTLDCDKFAQNDGWDSGECVESEAATDCFGCQASASGTSRACCDVQKARACCENKGECWKP